METTSPPQTVRVFEEYRFFVEDTRHLSDRRQAISQFFLTVNTAIFVVLAFLIRDSELRGWALVLVSIPIFLTGLVTSLMWFRIIQQYKALIGWRFSQLQEIERSPGMTGSHQFYTREWEEFFKPRQDKERFGFSLIESWLPRLFGTLYLVYLASIVVAAITDRWSG